MSLTASEHQLMFEMFKEQQMLSAAIVEILRANGTIRDGDLAAYDDLLRRGGKQKMLELQLAASYRGFAKVLGSEVDLILSTDARE